MIEAKDQLIDQYIDFEQEIPSFGFKCLTEGLVQLVDEDTS